MTFPAGKHEMFFCNEWVDVFLENGCVYFVQKQKCPSDPDGDLFLTNAVPIPIVHDTNELVRDAFAQGEVVDFAKRVNGLRHR